MFSNLIANLSYCSENLRSYYFICSEQLKIIMEGNYYNEPNFTESLKGDIFKAGRQDSLINGIHIFYIASFQN